MNITAGSAEHKALVSEYYKGNDGNYSQTVLDSLDNKLAGARLLANFYAASRLKFYAAAAQQCKKVRFFGALLDIIL